MIRKNLDKKYEEGMQYGAIGYYVPRRALRHDGITKLFPIAASENVSVMREKVSVMREDGFVMRDEGFVMRQKVFVVLSQDVAPPPAPRKIALNSPRRVVDTHAEMLKRVAPMSNTERQRRFRERHPGYYGRLHRKRRAGIKATLAQRWAEARAQAQAEAQVSVAAVKRVPLMLPAPVIDPLASEIAAA